MNRLKNKKVFVGKYLREIQEKAFELGFKWKYSGSTEVSKNFDVPFLYFEESGEMSGIDSLNIFYNESCDFEEVTPEYILNLEVKEKPQWEDFGKISGYFVRTNAIVDFYENSKSSEETRNLFPTEEEAKACRALSQLCQWRDRYNQGWEPDWRNYGEKKYIIRYYDENLYSACVYKSRTILAFKSLEIRNKFVEDFKDLIEQAKPLL